MRKQVLKMFHPVFPKNNSWKQSADMVAEIRKNNFSFPAISTVSATTQHIKDNNVIQSLGELFGISDGMF